MIDFNIVVADGDIDVASLRLRLEVAKRAVGKRYTTQITTSPVESRIHMFAKHYQKEHEVKWLKASRMSLYDVVDPHFDRPELGEFYTEMCANAHAITCNSEQMRKLIFAKVGRTSTVIPEPYEYPRGEPAIGEECLWYGNLINMPAIVDLLPMPVHTTIITRIPEHVKGYSYEHADLVEWSHESMLECLGVPCVVVLPCLKKTVSANRLVTAIRAGRFAVASPMPAYQELADYCLLTDDIAEGVRWALEHRDEALAKVAAGQEYIRDRYSPETVGMMWVDMVENLLAMERMQA